MLLCYFHLNMRFIHAIYVALFVSHVSFFTGNTHGMPAASHVLKLQSKLLSCYSLPTCVRWKLD